MNPEIIIPILTAVTVLCLLWTLAVEGRYHLHMYQLSSYYVSRYAKWQKQNLKISAFVLSVAAMGIAAAACFFPSLVALIGVMALVKTAFFYKAPVQKKKMVYTARVKRQIAVFFALYAIAGTAAVLASVFDARILQSVLIAFLSVSAFFPFLWVSLSGICNLPIENAVQRHYVKDAARILSENPSLTVVGVTGSYGKTTSKYMLGAVLSEKYNTLVTPESYNTLMGVVKTIRSSLTPLHQVFVVEMGAKHVGEIAQISALVKPDHALITTIGIQHLETFGSEENIVKAKFELVDALGDNGIAFLNYDCQKISQNNKHEKTVSFGFSEDCDYRAEDVVCSDKGTSFTLCCKDGRRISLTTKLLGRHNVIDLVSACAVGIELGVSETQLRAAAARLAPVEHRLELRSNGAYTVIDNAFNSNPSGAAEALYVLSKFDGYTKIAVTPGFIELGAMQEKENRELGRRMAEVCDVAVVVGKYNGGYITEGLKEANFGGKLITVDTLNEALGYIPSLEGEKKAVLFENDLPDNFEPQGK